MLSLGLISFSLTCLPRASRAFVVALCIKNLHVVFVMHESLKPAPLQFAPDELEVAESAGILCAAWARRY